MFYFSKYNFNIIIYNWVSISLIFKYFPNLNVDFKQKVEKLFPLYKEHNSKVNLISRKDFDCFYEKHVLHSLSISKFFQFKKGQDIMDLGTGGGFPGLPLAILFPDTKFYLVDSIKKKTDCVSRIVSELKLTNVQVINARSEILNKKFDYIVSRAVASLTKLDSWSNNKFKEIENSGLICLKGGDLSYELKGFENRVKIIDISNYFEEDFFLTKKIIFLQKTN